MRDQAVQTVDQLMNNDQRQKILPATEVAERTSL